MFSRSYINGAVEAAVVIIVAAFRCLSKYFTTGGNFLPPLYTIDPTRRPILIAVIIPVMTAISQFLLTDRFEEMSHLPQSIYLL